jgi:hypothetical protein
MKRHLPLVALVVGLAAASALPKLLGTGNCTECTPFSCPPSAAPKRKSPTVSPVERAKPVVASHPAAPKQNGPDQKSEPCKVLVSRR